MEHIENLNSVFCEASRCLQNNGLMYISELHPDRQLIGKTARFNLANEEFKIPAYVHQQEEYIAVAKNNGFKLEQIKHQNDLDGKQNTARLIILRLENQKGIRMSNTDIDQNNPLKNDELAYSKDDDATTKSWFGDGKCV